MRTGCRLKIWFLGVALAHALWSPAARGQQPTKAPEAQSPATISPSVASQPDPADAPAGSSEVAPAAASEPTAQQTPEVAPEPSAAAQERYRYLVARAVVEFDAGRFVEARTLFLRAHELWPSARTLRVLGMTSFELRNYARALQELEAALADTRRPLGDEHRREVTALVEQTRPFVGRYRVHLNPADALLRVDDIASPLAADGSLVLEVGNHELVARADGYAVMRRQLSVEGREDTELVITLVPTLTPTDAERSSVGAASKVQEPLRKPAVAARNNGFVLWPWTLGGAVVTGGTAIGVFLFIDARARKCRPHCSDPETSAIRAGDAVWISTAVVSGALAITTVVAFLYREDRADQAGDKADAVSFGVGPGYVAARGSF